MSFKKVYKILERNGWEIIRKKGSHVRWEHKETGAKTTVAWCEGSFDRVKMKCIEKQFGVKLA
jgi:predicted RNA binding protein YcfA (HicA-like mRNA interferase family)